MLSYCFGASGSELSKISARHQKVKVPLMYHLPPLTCPPPSPCHPRTRPPAHTVLPPRRCTIQCVPPALFVPPPTLTPCRPRYHWPCPPTPIRATHPHAPCVTHGFSQI